MSNTERYRRQHAEITRLAGELKRQLNPEALSDGATGVHSVLSELSGKLFVHLAAEDKVFYPQLLESTDPRMQALAERYIEEMRPISQAYKNYAVRWGSARAIESNAETFIRETREILAALDQRIRREHDELYALADQLELAAR